MLRRVIAILVLVASLGVLGGGVWYWWYTTPPPMPGTMEEGIALMGSGRYKRLSEPEKRRYVERMAEMSAKMSKEQQDEFGKRMREKAKNDPALKQATRDATASMMMSMARKYAQKSPEDRKKDVNAAVLAMDLQEWAASLKPKSAPKQKTPEQLASEAKKRDEMNKWMHDMLRTGNPQEQQWWEEFFKEIMAARKAKGKEPFPKKPQ